MGLGPVAPALLVVGVLALRWWNIYRDQVDSDEPLDVPGHGSFSGEAKRVLARKAVLLVFGLSVLAVLAFVLLPRLLGKLGRCARGRGCAAGDAGGR